MEPHLHLNVFTGGHVLICRVRVGGQDGFKNGDNRCGGLSECSAEVVKLNRESCMNGQLVVYKRQYGSPAARASSVFAERKDKFVH